MNELKIRDALNQLIEAAKKSTEAVTALKDEGISICYPFSNFFGRAEIAIQACDSVKQLSDILGTGYGEYGVKYGDNQVQSYRYFTYHGVEIKEIMHDEVDK